MPAVVGGGEQRVAHLVGVGVRRAAGLVVEVVELADAGDSRPATISANVGRRQAFGSVSGSSVAASAYICSRHVQNVPPPPWVRPRSARWKAWLWALASPGSVRPRSALAAGRWRRDAGRDGGDRARRRR